MGGQGRPGLVVWEISRAKEDFLFVCLFSQMKYLKMLELEVKIFFLFFLTERGRACQKAIRHNQLMGQDPRTGIKTKNQGQWQNTKEEYLWTLGNFEGFKNESGGEHTLEAFNLLSQVGSEVLCFRWAREKWEVKDR